MRCQRPGSKPALQAMQRFGHGHSKSSFPVVPKPSPSPPLRLAHAGPHGQNGGATRPCEMPLRSRSTEIQGV
jgi:hypothetical protein